MIHGKARRIMLLLKEKTTFVTTERKIKELREALAEIAEKRGLDLALLVDGIDSLPVEIRPESVYKDKLPEANRRIAKRDATDADLLALALAEGCPIWSQDKDFEGCGVDLYTTQRILKALAAREF